MRHAREKGTVYAAGPIKGTTFAACTTWRRELQAELYPLGIRVISPMRFKDFLRRDGRLGHEVQSDHPLCRGKGIWTRDTFDVSRCDVLFANLLGTTEVSIGTVAEIAIAGFIRKPIVLAMELDNIHRHAFVTEPAGYWVHDYREGVEIVKAILCDG